MRDALEIVIHKTGLKLYHPTDSSISEFVSKDENVVTEKIGRFIQKISASSANVHLFVAEDLLYFKTFHLPLDTVDMNEAVGYQLEMLTPFSDESTWYSFSSVRDEGAYLVSLFAAQSQFIDVHVQEIIDAGYHVSGLYPESQRYLNKINRKGSWGLLLPGRFVKAYVFNGTEMIDRLLCSAEPSFPEAVEVCKTDVIFRLDPVTREEPLGNLQMPAEKPYFDYVDARFLLQEKPLLKSHNMLPAFYQRPDYSKIIIAVLVVLNVVTLLAFGGVKVYKLKYLDDQVDQEIEKIMPLVNEMKELRFKEEAHVKALTRFDALGQNFDLISFLSTLTAELPTTSYVDQIRMDQKNNSVHIQGYTEDINDLTTKLQNVGSTQLKSTSRRKNKTYFHVEVSL